MASAPKEYSLGTVEASEQLIRDLYLDLRGRVHAWSRITKQTDQARMGYIGQHLVSVATGFPGGKSGARGYDIVFAEGRFGEIKTCYRVDQLGKCVACGAVVASTEATCSTCGSIELKRNDDSKWLISIRNEQEFVTILDPKVYYLVLFEFEDLSKADTIIASIWQVDPTVPGFALCMIDYYLNIREHSKSKAPFNLWPYSLKFELMRPELIYRSRITADSKIVTERFPNQTPLEWPLSPLEDHARSSKNLTDDKIGSLAKHWGLAVPAGTSRAKLLGSLRAHCAELKVHNSLMCDIIARELYLRHVKEHFKVLPKNLQAFLGATT